MWLLNAARRRLEYFDSEDEVPGGYAILSHTWDRDEVTFDDMQNNCGVNKKAFGKIYHTCCQALADGLKYAWVDTCKYWIA